MINFAVCMLGCVVASLVYLAEFRLCHLPLGEACSQFMKTGLVNAIGIPITDSGPGM